MSIQYLTQKGLPERKVATGVIHSSPGSSIVAPSGDRFIHPAWPTLPDITGQQRLVGSYAVFPSGSNYIALLAIGNYTVDWGDGVVENYNSTTPCYHEYDYNNVNLIKSDVAFQATANTVTRTSHGFQNGWTVSFDSITTTTGIVAGQIYYVVNATADTFQVSTSVGGAAIDLIGDGTGSLLEYKIAVVSITPQSGQNLTSIELNRKHNTTGLESDYSSRWLDIKVEGGTDSVLTSMILSIGPTGIRHAILERFSLKSHSVTSLSYCFSQCSSLWSLSVMDTSNVTNWSHMFSNCFSLTSIPLLDTSNGTNFTSMFNSCYALASIPLLDTSKGTNFTSMFLGCYALSSIPLLDTSKGTNFSGMFNSCYTLTYVPLLDTSKGTNFTSMFLGCYALSSIPLLDTSNGTTFSNMFNSCYTLTSIPLLDTSKGTIFTSMFSYCRSLASIPLLDTSKGTSFSDMFSYCHALTYVPLLDTSKGTTFTNMFIGCYTLTSIPLFDTSKGTSFNSMFNSCQLITSIPLLDISNGDNFASMFSNCYSLASIPLFDTSKGTSFNGMFSGCPITSIPLLDTSNGTNFTNMFSSCRSLASIPLFDTFKGTNFTSMFSNCFSLTSIPLLDTSNGTIFTSMFNSCRSLASIPLFDTSKGISFNSMFSSCFSLTSIPLLDTSKGTNFSGMFSDARTLVSVPLLNTSNGTNFASMFSNCYSLSKGALHGTNAAISYIDCKLSKESLEEIFWNLARRISVATITVSSNPGVGSIVSKSSCGTTVGSTTITQINTSSIEIGMQVTGTGAPATTAMTGVNVVAATNTAELIGHGLSDGDEVAFSTIPETTGILTNTIYYVVNATANTFQVADTHGGSAKSLTNNGTGAMKYRTVVTDINPNVSITVSRPMTSTASNTLAFRHLRTDIALLKLWTVTG